MKFVIVSKGDTKSNALKDRMVNYMAEMKMEYDETAPEMVISVGGDGTLLQAFHRYQHLLDAASFVGVHTGHLGFYADWLPHEVERLIISIQNDEYQLIEYPLLEIIITYEKFGAESRYLALNESTLRTDDGTTLVSDIDIRNQHFERFRGDGICVSTPSGSTAYNKALGGAIIHPSIEALQLTEIASINNSVFRTVGSPLVLPKHHTTQVNPVNSEIYKMTVDHINLVHKGVRQIQFRVADEKVKFARFRPFPFWKRVHDSFISDRN
ncbi:MULTISPECIES: NAD kinase [Bacillales]|uniref:NAD kinase n=1 Tax=Lacicoccus qingdaonensis TaxID=576118 RepID=A0A1G9EA68_9BACL|nr:MULTISPECIES: NAD kinase [Salinicoccus]SDK73060.1 NAD+ kinase [Salinicoccus qingdaonensis]